MADRCDGGTACTGMADGSGGGANMADECAVGGASNPAPGPPPSRAGWTLLPGVGDTRRCACDGGGSASRSPTPETRVGSGGSGSSVAEETLAAGCGGSG